MKKILHIIMFNALFGSHFAHGQVDTLKKKDQVQIKIGVFYNSGLNYYGRTDSLESKGFFPLAEVWFNKSVYVNAAPVFIINDLNSFQYAGTVATFGTRFEKEKKWLSHIYLVKPLYLENTKLVQSALKAQLAGSYSRLTKNVNVTIGGDVKLSDKFDYGVSAGLDRPFRFEPDDQYVIVLVPTAFVHAGTQQFTKTSYKQSGFLLFPGVQQQITEQVTKFNILSYEFSMPIVIAKGKFQFIANPAYVMPQNLVTVEGRPELTERGKNMFYVTTGVRIAL